MTIAFLNGQFLPLDEARISPLDRGFLFGDGIYEVIPSYAGKAVGLKAHIARLRKGLANIEIRVEKSDAEWHALVDELITQNQQSLGENIGIYLHVSRGADTKRYHAYPDNVMPTVFGYAFAIGAPFSTAAEATTGGRCGLTEDLRWQRCHIKSTALLGNVMHYQQARSQDQFEMLLHNQHREITEASSSNVFIVKDGKIKTPPLDNQLLPGITRQLVISILNADGVYPVVEERVTVDELLSADEVWITSSSKEIVPVTHVDGHQIGSGKAGDVWAYAIKCYAEGKFNY